MNAITTSMSESPSPMLDAAIEEAMAGYDVAAARVDRLLAEAFDNPTVARAAFIRLVRQKGVDETIRILTNEGDFGRLYHFGFTRGALFARGNRHLAKQALAELPGAIRDRQVIATKLHDLSQARRTLLERTDRERLVTRIAGAESRPRGRLRE